MKIGIFDSGLGGLTVMRAVVKKLPTYDYVYLGDTKRVPYGSRSQEAIYEFTRAGVDFLFKKGCALILIACNSASTEALRRIQMEYLPKQYPNRRVLGVIIPTAEVCVEANNCRVGVLGTSATVRSGVFPREMVKLDPSCKVYQNPAPLLAPMIEHGGIKFLEPVIKEYLAPLLKKKVETILLGCTHYALTKKLIRRLVPKGVRVVSQDEILPKKLESYLLRHGEIEKKLSQEGTRNFFVTDRTPTMEKLAAAWFGKQVDLAVVDL